MCPSCFSLNLLIDAPLNSRLRDHDDLVRLDIDMQPLLWRLGRLCCVQNC